MTPAAGASRSAAAPALAPGRWGLALAVGYMAFAVACYLLGPPSPQGNSLPVIWTAIAVGAASAVVLGRPNPLPDGVVPWVCPALVGPMALYPLFAPLLAPGRPGLAALAAVLLLAATLPLDAAIARLPPGGSGNLARAAVPALGLSAALLVILPLASPDAAAGGSAADSVPLTAVDWASRVVALAALLWPSAAAFTVLLRRQRTTGIRPAQEVLGDAALLVAAVGPVVTGSVLLIPWIYSLPLIGLAALAVFAGSRVAVRPLAAISARAAAQRDLAIAASEAERARLAADLHDGPLQDLLLLARSLEARDDAEGARLARDVADELRELSGDLRLPVLDDLGLGPALDWLAARARRLTGMSVSAQWEAAGRPPRQVELAAFRVGQEAVSNAIRHGRPPVQIRCRSAGDRLVLSVVDAGDWRGPGAEAAGVSPGGTGRGVIGMAQRAEQIGARLEVRRGEGVGTAVVLEWGDPVA